jgi:hypothetical protein
MADLKGKMNNNPENFTVWFNIIMNQHFDKLNKELCHESM